MNIARQIVVGISILPIIVTTRMVTAEDDVLRHYDVVSLVSLIDRPAEYFGKYISVVGYLGYFDGLRLYLTEQHAELHDYASSISVIDDSNGGSLSQGCRYRWARVRGKISDDGRGRYVIYPVHDVMDKQAAKDCWRTED